MAYRVYYLIDAFGENYIDEKLLNAFKEKIFHCNKVLNGYIAYLNKSLQGTNN